MPADENLKAAQSYDVTELVSFVEQPNGSVGIEPGSDEELALRGDWLSRLMFAPLLAPPLAYREERSYEEWLAARGLILG